MWHVKDRIRVNLIDIRSHCAGGAGRVISQNVNIFAGAEHSDF